MPLTIKCLETSYPRVLLLGNNSSKTSNWATVKSVVYAIIKLKVIMTLLANRFYSIRRRDDTTKTDYYFFYNQGIMSPPDEPTTLFEPATGQLVEREVSLEGSGQPYLLDAWSGKITPLGHYQTSGDRVTFRLKLSRDNGALIAFSETPNRFGVNALAMHVAQTTADEAVVEGNTIVIRAAKAGTYSTTLSNGRSIKSAIGA